MFMPAPHRRQAQAPALVGQHQLLAGAHVDLRAEVVRIDRQLAAAAVGEHRQAHRARPPEIEQLVQRGADGAAGMQHVVDQHHLAPVDGERDLAAPRLAVQADAAEVVAVQRDRERAQRHLRAQRAVQALGEPHAAGVDADEAGVLRDHAAHLRDERLDQLLRIGQRAHETIRSWMPGSSR
jgi:hypothetical protein